MTDFHSLYVIEFEARKRAEARIEELERLATENGRLAQSHWDRAERAEAERDAAIQAALSEGVRSGDLEAKVTRLREALRWCLEHRDSERFFSVGVSALSEEPRQTHGRDCPCTPCRAEDWDAVDRALSEKLR